MENLEYLTLLKCNVELTSEISADPLSVSSALVAKGLIPESVHNSVQLQTKEDEVKASEIVSKVTNKAKTFPDTFHEFLEVLGGYIWLKRITELLSATYDKLKSQDKRGNVDGSHDEDAAHSTEGI